MKGGTFNPLLFLGIGILLLVVFSQSNLQNIFQEKEDFGMTIHYYKDGKEVIPQKGLFSIVTPDGGSYDQIRFSVSGTATGVSYSDVKVSSAFPTAFKNSLPTTTQGLAIGQLEGF